ncbi:MFS transporter [Salinicoccus roseus]|uniref:MFS transporter n=1 Tax=Salinicoccus roseus TaxID=45670 RepID=UPI003DA0FA6C
MKNKNNFYYGWVIVAVCGLAVFFSGPGQTYSNAAFIDEYIKEFGWSRTEVSSLYSFATLVAGFVMIGVGNFIDRFGQKKMMIIAAIVLALATFFNSFVQNMFMLAIGFFFIRLFGQASMTLIPNTLVPQWFIRKRGLAFSLMMLGSFSSAMLFPIINVWLISEWGCHRMDCAAI